MGDFKTIKGYGYKNENLVAYSMEDYIEMIYRKTLERDGIRIGETAKLLGVKPSSVSKMAARLKKEGLINYEKYGLITLTDLGERLGRYLLERHEILTEFFTLLNGEGEYIKEVEQTEHYFSRTTVENLSRLNKFIKEYKFR